MLKNAILITGAGQRIGLYLANKFMAETNYPVVFTYRTPRSEVDELMSLGAKGYQVDFCDQSALADFLVNLKDDVSSMRALIHNASLWIPETKVTSSTYQQMFDVHMKAPYDITNACIPLLQNCVEEMKDIIALTDWKAQRGHENYISYLSTKAGLESLMQSFARKLAPDIKANSVSPALVMFNEGDTDDYKKSRLEEMANPREIGPQAIWDAVQFLMKSAHASHTKIELGHLRAD